MQIAEGSARSMILDSDASFSFINEKWFPDEDVFDILTLEGSVKSRDHVGGTSPDQVKSAAERALLKIQNR